MVEKEDPVSDPNKSPILGQWDSSTLLNLFLFSTKNCKGRDHRGYRFPEVLKLICAFIFIISGRILYNFFSANFPIPGLNTTRKFIKDEAASCTEGELRVTSLEKFLELKNLPKTIWLSEDLTGENRFFNSFLAFRNSYKYLLFK